MVLISEIHFDPSVFFCFLFSLVTTSRYETPIMYFFLNGGKRPGTRLSARAKTIEPGEGKSIARLAPLAFFFFFCCFTLFSGFRPSAAPDPRLRWYLQIVHLREQTVCLIFQTSK